MSICTPGVKELRKFVNSTETGKEFQASSHGHQRNKKVSAPDFETEPVFPNAP